MKKDEAERMKHQEPFQIDKGAMEKMMNWQRGP
jgi:hypothetical protein